MIHTVQKVVRSPQVTMSPLFTMFHQPETSVCENVQEQKLLPFIREMESRVRQGVSSARSSSEDLVVCGYTFPVLNVNVDWTTGRLSGIGAGEIWDADSLSRR